MKLASYGAYIFLVTVMATACNPMPSQTQSMQDAKTGSPSPTLGIESNSTAPNIEHMPIYPAAQQVEVETHMSYPPWSKTSFQIATPYQEVFAYYKDALPKQGWLLISESTEEPALS